MKRFIKAVVLNGNGCKGKLKRGSIVELDTDTLQLDPFSLDRQYIAVVGSNWGLNLISRFGIDPLAK